MVFDGAFSLSLFNFHMVGAIFMVIDRTFSLFTRLDHFSWWLMGPFHFHLTFYMVRAVGALFMVIDRTFSLFHFSQGWSAFHGG